MILWPVFQICCWFESSKTSPSGSELLSACSDDIGKKQGKVSRIEMNVRSLKKIYQQSILPNFFIRKTNIFSIFCYYACSFLSTGNIFLCYKRSSSTIKIEEQRKPKFGRIDSRSWASMNSATLQYKICFGCWSQKLGP